MAKQRMFGRHSLSLMVHVFVETTLKFSEFRLIVIEKSTKYLMSFVSAPNQNGLLCRSQRLNSYAETRKNILS